MMEELVRAEGFDIEDFACKVDGLPGGCKVTFVLPEGDPHPALQALYHSPEFKGMPSQYMRDLTEDGIGNPRLQYFGRLGWHPILAPMCSRLLHKQYTPGGTAPPVAPALPPSEGTIRMDVLECISQEIVPTLCTFSSPVWYYFPSWTPTACANQGAYQEAACSFTSPQPQFKVALGGTTATVGSLGRGTPTAATPTDNLFSTRDPSTKWLYQQLSEPTTAYTKAGKQSRGIDISSVPALSVKNRLTSLPRRVVLDIVDDGVDVGGGLLQSPSLKGNGNTLLNWSQSAYDVTLSHWHKTFSLVPPIGLSFPPYTIGISI